MPTSFSHGRSNATHRGQRAYFNTARREIAAWEAEPPSLPRQVEDFILEPAEQEAAAMLPQNVTETVCKAVATGLASLLTPASIATKTPGKKNKKAATPLETADREARRTWRWNICCAAAQATAGDHGKTAGVREIRGPAEPAVDAAALIGTLLWQVQAIATCYGYDPERESEQIYLLHLLCAGLAATRQEKAASLAALKRCERTLAKPGHIPPRRRLLGALRQSALPLGLRLARQKALRSIPIIAVLTGFSFEGALANDTAKTAYMSYRRRWLASH